MKSNSKTQIYFSKQEEKNVVLFSKNGHFVYVFKKTTVKYYLQVYLKIVEIKN